MLDSVLRSLLTLLFLAPAAAAPAAETPPNIVIVLADDLGYGDLQCYNAESKIDTPHANRLASQGMLFTDAHSGSAVCTPTRYGLITGRYSWRSRLQSGVLGGLSPRLIEPARETVASLLKQQGYHTACIGKWHLGMDWVRLPGKQVAELSIEPREFVWNVDYSQPIANGPNSVGFDYFYGIAASLDMVPYTYIENDRVTKLPTEDRDFPMFLGRKQGRCRKGPTAPGFDVADVLPDLARKSAAYIDERAAEAKQGRPFFLYLPLASPHTPIVSTDEWQGKTGLNFYGDFVAQTDWAVGQLLEALDRHGLTDDTLFVFTNDNGCSPQAGFPDLLAKGHDPNAPLRGHKADIYEGGHRVPFIVRWPGRVKPGSRSDQLICLNDLFATCAEVAGANVPDEAGEDSVSLLPALLGKDEEPLKEAVVHHSVNGSFAIRQGRWKLALCPGSGGWSAPRPGRDDTSNLPRVQLFDLQHDLGEQNNVQDEHPQVVERLTRLLEKYVAEGRSTPGKRQSNTVPVNIRRGLK